MRNKFWSLAQLRLAKHFFFSTKLFRHRGFKCLVLSESGKAYRAVVNRIAAGFQLFGLVREGLLGMLVLKTF